MYIVSYNSATAALPPVPRIHARLAACVAVSLCTGSGCMSPRKRSASSWLHPAGSMSSARWMTLYVSDSVRPRKGYLPKTRQNMVTPSAQQSAARPL